MNLYFKITLSKIYVYILKYQVCTYNFKISLVNNNRNINEKIDKLCTSLVPIAHSRHYK